MHTIRFDQNYYICLSLITKEVFGRALDLRSTLDLGEALPNKATPYFPKADPWIAPIPYAILWSDQNVAPNVDITRFAIMYPTNARTPSQLAIVQRHLNALIHGPVQGTQGGRPCGP